tara:strand:+ start:3480 stop:4250 length:771 start_codon:yes stop_codon:yes gene_type:complete
MAEIHFDFLNFNTILLLLLILLIGGYLYYEIHKMKFTLNDIHSKLNYLLDNNIPSEEPLNSIPVMNNKDILNEEVLNGGIVNEEILNEGIVNVKPNEEMDNIQMSEIKGDLKRQMMDDSDSDSSDSHSDSSDDNSSDSESRISQSEIEKDYGKNAFEQENNSASIDDILSDKHIITDNSLSDILNVDSDLTKIDEFIQNIKSDKEEITTKDMSTKDMVKDYNDMTVSELKKVLVDMKLPVSGNKTKLIERILENKN